MRTKQLLKQFKSEAQSIMPDCKDRIKVMAIPRETVGNNRQQHTQTNKTAWRKVVPAFCLIAVLVVGIVLALPILSPTPVVMASSSVVLLEINPKFEISSDKNEIVTSIRGLNKQAVVTLNGEESKFVGKNVSVVLEELLLRAHRGGYIKNTISVTAVSGSTDYEGSLDTKLKSVVVDFAQKNNLSNTKVVARGEGRNVKEEAKKYGITETKMNLCLDIIEKFPNMSIDKLVLEDSEDLTEILSEYNEVDMKKFSNKLKENFEKVNNEKDKILKNLDKLIAEVKGEISALDTLCTTEPRDYKKINSAIEALNMHYKEPIFEEAVSEENIDGFVEDLKDLANDFDEEINDTRKELLEKYDDYVTDYNSILKNGVDSDDDFDLDDLVFDFELDIDITFNTPAVQ